LPNIGHKSRSLDGTPHAMSESMKKPRRYVRATLFCSALSTLLAVASTARADGTAQLGLQQALQTGTRLYVDIVDPATERIRWTGVGSVTVKSPNGTSLGTFASGAAISPTMGLAGRDAVSMLSNQSTGVAWDLSVQNQSTAGGRVYSYDWQFNAGSFASTAASDGSFYAVVPVGAGDQTAVIELKLSGLAGFIYQINANRIGVNGSGGLSVPISGRTVTPEFPIYLQPPTLATYSSINPTLSAASFRGGAAMSVLNTPMSCDQFVSGSSTGTFSFVTDTLGTYNVICDIDGDGEFSRSSARDVLLVGATTLGVNTVSWNGKDKAGATVGVGAYSCRIEVHAGEFHYVGRDIETSYLGMRMFEVEPAGTRRGLDMFWNDAAVQSLDQLMPNGQHSQASSGDNGMASGAYTAAATPNTNARAWGNFSGGGKGNDTFLDTYVWLSESVSLPIQTQSVNGTVDTDADGLTDFEERCDYGTDPANPDTDGDGTPDGTQYRGGATPGAAGGLESNGRLAVALGRRQLAQTLRRSATNASRANDLHKLSDEDPQASLPVAELGQVGDTVLAALLPAAGPRDATARSATPSDLPAVTNAKAVAARDYVDANGTPLGTVLLIETAGAVYEHTKAVCDRAHGATLVDVGASASELPALRAETIQGAQRDRSITVVLYEDMIDDKRVYTAYSRWLAAARRSTCDHGTSLGAAHGG
jgi:hypothetical protein